MTIIRTNCMQDISAIIYECHYLYSTDFDKCTCIKFGDILDMDF